VRVERKTVVLGSISHHAVTDQENYWLSKGWRVIPPWPDEGGILKLERDVPDTAPIPVRYRPRRAYRRPRPLLRGFRGPAFIFVLTIALALTAALYDNWRWG
jgi:hypothetical protein